MKRFILTSLLIALLGIPIFLQGQYFKFVDFNQTTGKSPFGSVILDDAAQTLYGMTYDGGANNFGTIFKFELSGAGYIDLLDLSDVTGINPHGSLLKVGGTLFGMTSLGGANSSGTLFKLKTDGTGFTKLHDFKMDATGASPLGSLIISGNILYGMANQGGTGGVGVVFSIDTNGNNYTVLHSFSGSDGSGPVADLTIDGNMLFGMTKYGGTGSNFGVIFRMETNGANFSKFFNFDWLNSGGYPLGSLTFIDGNLYGMTSQGGENGDGTIFKVSAAGIGYARLFSFAAATSGRGPWGNLVYDGTSFYGMADGNGSSNYGSIFSISTDGTNYDQIYGFTSIIDGSAPRGTPVVVPISGGTIFYGMVNQGGFSSGGVLFKYNTLGAGIHPITDGTTLSVFPVPAKDFLNISFTESIREIRILDVLGNTVYIDEPGSGKDIRINIENLQSGVYFLKVKGNYRTETGKFVKQ